ncbi:uncharacterized protein LOC132048243 [Lycium ferocissimum]|uniref:uncharacterized protein LOC132048243 n=1 Tax=Lycium ferocissimum TaxID=112874 RepID=UPI002814E4C2|nr:uncharacterized protein LOC132048243 [Lycium ferocissimum]
MKVLADFLSCYSGSVSDNSPKIESCSLVQVTCLEENITRGRKLARRNSSSKGLWQPSLYTISENETIKAQERIKAARTKKMKTYRPKPNSQPCVYYNDLRVQAQFQTSIMALSAATFLF